MKTTRKYSDRNRAGQLEDAETDLATARARLAALPAPREDDLPIVASRYHRACVAVDSLAAIVDALRGGKPLS